MHQNFQNQAWLRRSQDAVWHPCTQMKRHETLPLIPIARGDGVWLYDMDGHRYLDAVSSWWVNLFGHNQPRIKTAITAQMDQLEHVMLAGFTHQPVVELSEQLAELTGLGHAFYGSDGASATEIALKMAAHYWRNLGLPEKNRFVYLQDSYHGETVGALSVTDVPIFRTAYAPLVRENFSVQSPDSRQAQGEQTAEDVALWALQDLERVLVAHHHEIAALIVEPLVQGAAGMAMYHPIYLAQARILCDKYSVLLIADEIAVGFGRTGTMFACEQAAIKPDLICLSKGITGGYLPLAAVLCSDAVYTAFYADETVKAFLHSHSYTGNALACAAALATLAIFKDDAVIAQNQAKAARFNAIFAPLAQHPRIQNWRQCGMIWAFEISDVSPNFASECFVAALKEEILLRPIGNTLYFMPPYTMTDAQAQFLLAGTLNALEKCW
ncbi:MULTISPECIES: adenosylmethionine--8-amino-7-oxononanoate transaminase [Deefgea]|uniref:Adenosylmethionine-8-amino-7-oxononanoate aminotransferase n=1 Tax=Deefgea chitinilytica TaxID=570276 RepID=A0ABS2C9D9_9NEIS|nr:MULTISPECIES: adenosylmethionine--8-amino-7-oxononanoate transaminase [Deefgea]MBM5570265.1 adenosylmethionine--8-amino-7-oxononanoate transaminase [Deefgea chitinilytica]MBM9887494.1 adenosylmethionine--8-amino-7-oxononanoate transaminase [Deefgea sp. CFH1-16]